MDILLTSHNSIQLETYNQVAQSHNLWIDPSGYAFIEHQSGDNIHIANILNPSSPIFEGSFYNLGSNCHDIYTRDGLAYISEGSSNRYAIYDISNLNNISNPIVTINCAVYSHNAWLNDLGNHLITTEETQNKTVKIFSKKDHRIAMSFFCLGQLLGGDVEINNFETVNTSFSKFLVIMKKIGAKYEIKK